MELQRQDGIEKVSITTLDRSKNANLARYEKFLNEDCSIPFSWYIDTSAKALKYRDMNGPEKHVVFQKINMPAIFPNLPHVRKLQGVWCKFYSLNQVLQREDTSDVDIAEYESSIRAWVREFTEIYQTRHITPYIHAFANHIIKVAWKTFQIQSTRIRKNERSRNEGVP